ncbi:MAG TPA: hypothetical protein PK765_00725 [bacterium]|nr:hypothetical protein [bacterium]
MWKTVATRQIFSHPRLTLIEDEVLLPNGEPTTYLRFDDRGGSTTSVIAIRDDGKILVQREYSHPLSRIIWQLPGGGIYA